MPVIESRIDPRSAAFAANAQRMGEKLAEVKRLEQLVIAESESKRARFLPCYVLKDGALNLFDEVSGSQWFAPPGLESGGGGLVGTADDYLRFCRMLLNKGELDGARLLSPKTVANHLSSIFTKLRVADRAGAILRAREAGIDGRDRLGR